MRAVPVGCRFVRTIGAGSTFEVAVVSEDGCLLVCKRVRGSLRGVPAAERALAREAAALDAARHPSLPELVAHDRDAHGPFVLQSLIEGESLRARVARGIDPSALHALALRSFQTLAELHALPLSLALGDIEPDHLIDTGAAIVFLDLSQARWPGMPFEPDEGERGTLPFVAPERLRGEAPADQPGDVFALAACFAFAALGRDPVHASDAPARLVEVADRGLDLAALATAAIDDRLRSALMQALAFDRAARASTAASVLERLSGRSL